MNILPFINILNADTVEVSPLTENLSSPSSVSQSDFSEILKIMITTDPAIKQILNELNGVGQNYIDKEIENINISNILWQLMTDKGINSIEACPVECEKTWGNIPVNVEKSGGVETCDEAKDIEKTLVELMRVVLNVISRLKDHPKNIQTPDTLEASIQKDTLPHIPVHTNRTPPDISDGQKDSKAPIYTKQPDINPSLFMSPFNPDVTILTSPHANAIGPSLFMSPLNPDVTAIPNLDKKTPDTPEASIQKDTLPHIPLHTNRTSPDVGDEQKDSRTPIYTKQPDINPSVFMPPLNPDAPYKIEIAITNNNPGGMGYGDSNIWIDPEAAVENKTKEASVRGGFYKNMTKDAGLDNPPPYSTEKGQTAEGAIEDIISIKDKPENAKIRKETLQAVKGTFDKEFDERIQEIRIFYGKDTTWPSFNEKDDGTISYTHEDKVITKITHEKIDAKNGLDDALEKQVVIDNAVNKNTVQLKDDIQAHLRTEMAQKIEDIIEQYSGVKKSGDMLIRFKIDDGEILQVNMKNEGENILVHIKSNSSELIGMFNDHKETIIKGLEEKNIFASIFINPDGANNPEKRQGRQGSRSYKSGKEQADDFSDLLEAQV